MTKKEKKMFLQLIREVRELRGRLEERDLELAEVERIVTSLIKGPSTFLHNDSNHSIERAESLLVRGPSFRR